MAGVLTSSAIRWQFNRLSLMTLLVAAIIGALMVPVMVVTGSQAAVQFERDQARLTKKEAIELPADLTGVKYYMVEGTVAANAPSYRADNDGEIKAELEYLEIKGTTKPQISVERRGDTLVVKSNDRCQAEAGAAWAWWLFGGRFNRCSLAGAHVNFYGAIRPAPASSTFYNSTFPIYDDEADNIWLK